MPNPNFHKIKKVAVNRYLTKVKGAYVWQDGEFQRVWSGASEVSYYDGDTLLGTIEVDDGEDVLHPPIETTKGGYTLYGWATAKGSQTRVTSLNADGNPISLYAIYLPNTVTIVSATLTADAAHNPVYSVHTHDTRYIDVIKVEASRWYSTGQFSGSVAFTLNKGLYQTCTGTVAERNRDAGYGEIDGYRFAGAEDDSSGAMGVTLAEGRHTLRVEGWCHHSDSWAIAFVGFTNLVLSNPIAWE